MSFAATAPNASPVYQITSLRHRMRLSRGMQVTAVISLIAGMTALLFAVNDAWAMTRAALLAGALLPGLMLLTALLALALREVSLSLAALDVKRAGMPRT
jgi:uncharacterized membrane protein